MKRYLIVQLLFEYEQLMKVFTFSKISIRRQYTNKNLSIELIVEFTANTWI